MDEIKILSVLSLLPALTCCHQKKSLIYHRVIYVCGEVELACEKNDFDLSVNSLHFSPMVTEFQGMGGEQKAVRY